MNYQDFLQKQINRMNLWALLIATAPPIALAAIGTALLAVQFTTEGIALLILAVTALIAAYPSFLTLKTRAALYQALINIDNNLTNIANSLDRLDTKQNHQ